MSLNERDDDKLELSSLGHQGMRHKSLISNFSLGNPKIKIRSRKAVASFLSDNDPS